MNRLYLLGGAGVVILVIFLTVWHQRKTETKIVSRILPADVQEKLIIDPTHHSLIILSDKGTKAITLPNRPSSIEVLKNGKLRLNVPQYGWEHSPFIGIGYSTQLNDYIGLDLWYWKQIDLGTSFGFDRNLKIRTLGFPIVISYTVYHNMRLSIGVEPFGEHNIHGLISVRI